MNEQLQKAFDFASESCKQLLTLSTAVLTLTITFEKDVVGAGSASVRRWLALAWVVYMVSIIAGGAMLLNLTGNLEPKNKSIAPALPTIWAPGICLCSKVQVVGFLIATTIVLGCGLARVS